MNESLNNVKKDITIILSISLLSAILYIAFGEMLMNYGHDSSHFLLLRFLPVFFIQFGMSCLGVLIVLIKNKEKLAKYGLIRKNSLKSIIGCMLASVPTVIFLIITNDIHSFLPFQGMFLTRDILNSAIPFNIIGYLVIALTWGLGEGLFYVVLSDKINLIYKPDKIWNFGAFICTIISITIHGMIGFNIIILLEALTTFILMYCSLIIRQRTGNAWGNILIFFLIWNAL